MPHDVADDATLAAAVALVRQNDAVRATTQPEPLRTLNDWLADPASLVPPKMIVPYLALGGRVTLLAAREKAGKSTLLGQAVAAFTLGGEFLGEQCGPGRVLWYAIDEAASDAVRRLSACNAEGDSVAIQRARPTPEDFRAHITEFRPALVVVDTLTELMTGRVQSEKDPQEMQKGLRPYIDVLRETDTAAVILHHQTKSGNQYRGSTQLGAMVDVLAELNIPGSGAVLDGEEDPDADPENERRRVLYVRGRGIDTRRDRLHFDGTEYRLGEGELGITARIIRAVSEGHNSKNKVSIAVKGRRETINATVQSLVEEGKLIKEGDVLRVPMFGGGSHGGSVHHEKHTPGTTSGTTFDDAHASGRTSREPLGKHLEIPRASTGTTDSGTRAGVVPVLGSYVPHTGTTPLTGPAADPFDWSAIEGAA